MSNNLIQRNIKEKLHKRAFLLSILWVFFTFQLSCQNKLTFTITGNISDFGRRDTAWVTLTKNWQHIRIPPDSFHVDKKGNFTLRFKTGKNTPPITVIKNRSVLTTLTIQRILGDGAYLIDETTGMSYPLKINSEKGEAAAKIKL